MMNVKGLSAVERGYIRKHHTHEIKANQCTSFLINHIKAPVHLRIRDRIEASFCKIQREQEAKFDALKKAILDLSISSQGRSMETMDASSGNCKSQLELPKFSDDLDFHKSIDVDRAIADEDLMEQHSSERYEEMDIDLKIGVEDCTRVSKEIEDIEFLEVWSLVRRFDQPQKYKPFVSRCIVQGNLEIGSVREVDVKSGLPATTSTERLELLDDNQHILSVKIVGGDHRLRNYSSVASVHPEVIDGRPGTVVIESFVVDVPEGNTQDETCYFVEALIRCNLKSLADVSERLAVQDRTEPINRACHGA
ncbi:hypothetical protein SASPL_152954 [Salvia splendens]|uniref:Abscisic acid receptor PYR/PYL family n=1 Tax=Salvia splendens TaxID=180675 RepID=A0A8X8Z0I7_SALSN|nr:hypothetical protein SASPL_152954 [Salvia splendens]